MIYILDYDPEICAHNYADPHLEQALIEACRVLSNVHHHYPSYDTVRVQQIIFREINMYSLFTEWCERDLRHYIWLARFAVHCAVEYGERNKKIHVCFAKAKALLENAPGVSFTGTVNATFTPEYYPIPTEVEEENFTIKAGMVVTFGGRLVKNDKFNKDRYFINFTDLYRMLYVQKYGAKLKWKHGSFTPDWVTNLSSL